MKNLKQFFFLFVMVSFSYTVNAQMTVGSMVVGQGVSGTNWVNYINQGAYIDVNTSQCGFTSTPHYLVTLENGSSRWAVSGVPSIYNATPNGFRVYIRWTDSPEDSPTVGVNQDPNPLQPATATNYGWVIRWTAISIGDCDQCGSDDREFNDSLDESSFLEPESREDQSIKSISSVKIFPNPTQTELNIKTEEKMVSCEIYDMRGQLLITTKENVINVEQLKSGNYSIRIKFKDSSITKQFNKL